VCPDLWPVDAEANRRHRRPFEAIVLEGNDHFLMLDAAEEFNRALEEAIAKIKP
jgi:pimeloyl-ACP methyl ester carboxylesterase